MDTASFGDHPVFGHWGIARDIAGGQVTYGAAVLPHLLEGVREHLARPAPRSWKHYRHRIGVGCVPWLTSPDVAATLARLDAVCVVIDKNRDTRMATALADHAEGLAASWLGLDDLSTPGPDGKPPVIGPYGPMPGAELVLGPVLAAGYLPGPGHRSPPLLHAKMLVLADVDDLDYGDENDGTRLTPVKVWLGSANWTRAAAQHLEFGLWSSDPQLVRATLDFLRDVIRVAEPLHSTAASPTPQYVDAEWDDDAFREAARELGPDGPDE